MVNLLISVQNILLCDIDTNNYFTINELENILKMKHISYNMHDLYEVIYTLLIDYGWIVRIDNWSSEAKFKVLDRYYFDKQNKFYEMIDDDNSDKTFLLIGDTHIGNKETQDFELINNIYEFALKNNIKNIFHLGDMFDGVRCNDLSEIKEEKVKEQINLFKSYYPKTNNVRTISLLGNHDKSIYGTYGTDVCYDYINEKIQIYDLRNLTKYNHNVLFYAVKTFVLGLNNIPIHFSHRFYLNCLFRDMILTDLNEIDELIKKWVPCEYQVYFSAHLHKSFIYPSYDDSVLYLGVPSTSKINRGNIVANLVNITTDGKILIRMLKSDMRANVYLDDKYEFKCNKVLKK